MLDSTHRQYFPIPTHQLLDDRLFTGAPRRAFQRLEVTHQTGKRRSMLSPVLVVFLFRVEGSGTYGFEAVEGEQDSKARAEYPRPRVGQALAIDTFCHPTKCDRCGSMPRIHQLERELRGARTREAVLHVFVGGAVPSHFRTPPETRESIPRPLAVVSPRMDFPVGLAKTGFDELMAVQSEPRPRRAIDGQAPRYPERAMKSGGQPRVHIFHFQESCGL